MAGGIKAPPETPMIINPEISFPLSGRALSCGLDLHAYALDKQLRGDRIRAHINTYNEEDAEEEQQDTFVFEKRENSSHRRFLILLLFLGDGGAHQPEARKQSNASEDREDVLPTSKPRGSECGNQRTREGGDSLHDLAGGQRAGVTIATHDIREEWVERDLQHRVTDTQQDEGDHAGGKRPDEEGDKHTDDRD